MARQVAAVPSIFTDSIDDGPVCYGAAVYRFMHLVVLPLSAAPAGHTPLVYKVDEFVEHWFCVGLPIALSVRHYSR